MTAARSVDRLFPPRPPEPTPGCVVCTDLDRKRTQALAERDYSRASDCNVRMRAHRCRTAPISR